MKAKSQKIGALEKVSFFLANVGNIPLMSLLSSFFTLFYTTIVGLDPAALGTLFLISKVSDNSADSGIFACVGDRAEAGTVFNGFSLSVARNAAAPPLVNST